MVQYAIKSILNLLKEAGYLEDLEIRTKTNIWLTKDYLKRCSYKLKSSWVKFCQELLDKDFEVFLYLPEKFTSMYITVVKNRKMKTIRFSDHLTKEEYWLRSDIDYYVGPQELGMLSEQEVWDVLNIYFR